MSEKHQPTEIWMIFFLSLRHSSYLINTTWLIFPLIFSSHFLSWLLSKAATTTKCWESCSLRRSRGRHLFRQSMSVAVTFFCSKFFVVGDCNHTQKRDNDDETFVSKVCVNVVDWMIGYLYWDKLTCEIMMNMQCLNSYSWKECRAKKKIELMGEKRMPPPPLDLFSSLFRPCDQYCYEAEIQSRPSRSFPLFHVRSAAAR